MSSQNSSVIIFFDGVCHLCNGFVDFLIQKDAQKQLKFAPLQGSSAAELLLPEDRASLETVLVYTPKRILRKSEAVIYAVSHLGGVFKIVTLLKLVPRFLRDLVYDFVAKNRYAWFGQRDSCRLPTPEERDRLLP